MVAGAMGIVALMAVQANYEAYFVRYAEVERLNTQNQREVAAAIKGYADLFGSDRSAFIVPWPYWVDYRLVALELGDFPWKEHGGLTRPEDAGAQKGEPGPHLYILHHDDTHGLEVMRSVFPNATVTQYQSAKPGKAFVSVFVPG